MDRYNALWEELLDTQKTLQTGGMPHVGNFWEERDWEDLELAVQRLHAVRAVGDCLHMCPRDRRTDLWNQVHNFVSGMRAVKLFLERGWQNMSVERCTPAKRRLLIRISLFSSERERALAELDDRVAIDTLHVHLLLDQYAFAVRLGRLHLMNFTTLANGLNQREHADLTGVVWDSERINECLPNGLAPIRAGTALQKLRRLVAVAETASVLLELNRVLETLGPRLGAISAELAHSVMHAAMKGKPRNGEVNHLATLDTHLLEQLIRRLALRDPFEQLV
jgi:hypothetical protein